MSHTLVIVESPSKAKTISKYLGEGYSVAASMGHIRDLPGNKLGIDVDNKFMPEYVVDKQNAEKLKPLKKLLKAADHILLATDEDREGEAISWHLVEALKIKKPYERIVFNEITKTAIQKAVKNPRPVDINLVNAQQARRVLDRLVGFELSPVLWKKISRGLSAGRVQSVAVRLVVEREREIEAFKAGESYRITGVFSTTKGEDVKVELSTRFETYEEAKKCMEDCLESTYTVAKVEKKDGKKSPSAPFTTSTLQQEASRKLGYSVSQTMRLAQKLYEGGHITYMRTDSVHLSDDALKGIASYVEKEFGKEFVHTRTYKTKSSSAQEAHEAIRPTAYDKQVAGGEDREKRLYNLIWKRAISSQMTDAALARTTAQISISKRKEHFIAKGEIIVFEGFMKVYGVDQKSDSVILPPLTEGDTLEYNDILAKQMFSKHPPRYTEASLVKKLEELGIGRPSTYAPTISTVQNRGYVEKDTRDGEQRDIKTITIERPATLSEVVIQEGYGAEKNKLFPTNMAMVVNDFLVKYFPDVVDYGFTAAVEKEFDGIAHGKKEWNTMIGEFYRGFHDKVEEVSGIDRKEVSSDRVLGEDPKTGKVIKARMGRFGPIVQIGESEDEDKKFAGLEVGQFIETITLDEALALFKFPRSLGNYEDKEVTIGKGRFGPYVKHDSKFVSIPKEISPLGITLEESIVLIEEKREKDKNKYIATYEDAEGKPVELLNGRYGPYIKYNKLNFKIPKEIEDPTKLTQKECLAIIDQVMKDGGPKKRGWKKTTAKKTAAKKTTTKKKTTKKAAPKKAKK